MNEDRQSPAEPGDDGNRIEPLPGEAGIPDVAVRRRTSWSRKGLLAVALLLVSVVGLSAYWLQRLATGGGKSEDPVPQVRDRPAAATTEGRRLEMPVVPSISAASAPATGPSIPAIVATPEELAEPIGVRRTGSGAPGLGGKTSVAPEDAPVMLLSTRSALTQRPSGSPAADPAAEDPAQGDGPGGADDTLDATRRNLQAYQRQLQGLLDRLASTPPGTGGPSSVGGILGAGPLGGSSPAGPVTGSPSPGSLFGGQLQGSATPRVSAGLLGDRSLTLPKGTVFTCALKTRVVSATSGFIGCQVQRNVYSDDGRVLLVERGSHLDGEYRATSIRPGTVRIPVLWTRVRTPLGVTVDIESPGTGQLGESGIDGYVDNRWVERIGAAMLVSLINDAVQLVIQTQTSEGSGDTIIFPSTTASTSKLAEKVLESTINIPPLIYQNQGGIVGIYVARDVDFSSVYELQPSARVDRTSESLDRP
jgi:type IV secretion system protein VirB10